MTKPAVLENLPDFSLVLGGPLFQLYLLTHLSGTELELMRRRVLVMTGVAWLPLLFLTTFEGHAFGGASDIPFLHDIEGHVRFLIVLPILIGAELFVHRRIRSVVQRFVNRGIIVPKDVPRLHAAVSSAMRVRDSAVVEIVILVLVYTLGVWIWRSQVALGTSTWYASHDDTGLHLTLAGYWLVFVSIPIFQFLLVRWYMRFLLWFQFLWRVSRLNLHLSPSHPDFAAGLGFLGASTYAFGPLLFAQGAMLAALIASQVFFAGQSLTSFKLQAGGFLLFFVVSSLSPLFVFYQQLARAKRDGLQEFGDLANQYVQEFDDKWLHSGPLRANELLGNPDFQSLADLGNAYTVVQEMRLVPFGLKDVIRLAIATAAPLLPLVLTVFSLADLLRGLIKILF